MYMGDPEPEKVIEISFPQDDKAANEIAFMFFNRAAVLGGIAFSDQQLIRRVVFDAIHQNLPLTKENLQNQCSTTCKEAPDYAMHDADIGKFKEVVGFMFDSVAQDVGLVPSSQIIEGGPKKPGERTGQMKLFEL